MEFFLAGVAILSAVFTYGFACPSECTCNYNSNGTYVYCNTTNIGYIPTNLPNTTYYLYLDNNNITVLDPKFTRSMPNLYYLNLDGNKIKTIEENSFVNLTNLRELLLCNNEISVIKENAFVNLPRLWVLLLYNNNITVIDPKMTRSMPNIYILQLNLNKIKTIEENSFVNLTNVYILDLANNEISVIKENAFVNLPGLGNTVNGQWSNWGSWTQCSMTCGNGTQYRNRYCNSPTPANSGSDCQGFSNEPVPCNNGDCPDTASISPVTESIKSLTTVSVDNNTVHDIVASVKNLFSDFYKSILDDADVNVPEFPYNGKTVSISNDTFVAFPNDGNIITIAQDNSSATNRLLEEVNAVSTSLDIGQKTDTSDISPVTESIKSLATVSVDNNTVHDIVGSVKNLTSDPTILKSIDIVIVADVLVNVSKLPSIDERVLDDIFDIIDSVINVNVSTLTKAQDKGSATNRLLEVVNAVSTSLDIGQKTSARFLRDNILMDVYAVSDMKSPVIGIQIDTGEFEALSNSTIKTIELAKTVTLNTSDAAIILPVEIIRGMNRSTRVALNVYRNWNLFAERSDIKQYDPNSRIVAASIIQDGRPVHSLEQYKVKALFYPRMERGKIVCGYWDYDLHKKFGGWATDGCVLNGTEFGRYVCICDHLTNFAVLVNVGGQDTLVDNLALKTISYIGLILSIIGLSLTVLSFIVLKHLRKGRGQQTLVNLAFSLLCFLIVFISGIEQTHDFYSCIAIAVLLHYFILVAFMWMLIEGILQYLRFVQVLGTYIPRFILKTAPPAWGVPLIPVIIVLALDHKLYHGGSKACWMSLSAFYYSFTVPVCVIVLANIIIFIMILKNLVCRPKGLTSNQSEKKRATMNLRASLSVLVLLGLTWIFGFFTIEGASVVFQYIFTILNVFQGFLIFVLFTAGDKQVRQGWKQLCCRQKQREKYLKTGTSSNENKSKIGTDNRNNNTELTEMDFSMNMLKIHNV